MPPISVGWRIALFDDEIGFELGRISSKIKFEDAVQTSPEKRRSTRKSLPSNRSSSKSKVRNVEKPNLPKESTSESKRKGRRQSEPPKMTGESDHLSPKRSPKKVPSTISKYEEFQNDLLTYEMHSHAKDILFNVLVTHKGPICKMCCSKDYRNDGKLVKCSACGDHVHSDCLSDENNESFIQSPASMDPIDPQRKRSSIRIRIEAKILCNECSSSSICFACKEEKSSTVLKRCDVKSCGRYYHTDCLDNWKQIKLIGSKFECPLHVCHSCFAFKNDRSAVTTKFTFCVKCPTAYHLDSGCIPAGTRILSQQQHICIRHRIASPRTIPKLDWCIFCRKEGKSLICCVRCPNTYHLSCLDSLAVPEPFQCENCINGMNPLYGQMVIAKFGIHPWWPAVIVPSFRVPAFMYEKRQKEHAFCIRFFGDYDFAWIGRSSVLFYSENDATKFLTNNPQQAKAFNEAAKWFGREKERDDNNNEIVGSKPSKRNEMLPSPEQPQYTKIADISLVAPAKLTKSMYEPVKCKCSCDPGDRCGLLSNCENRELCIECDPKRCPSGSYCKNQCFERKEFAAVKVVFINDKKGFGLIADEFISAGSFVMEYVGELITETELQRRKSLKRAGSQHFYFMTYSKGLFIDSEKKGNESRFVNHSCNPNCETQKWTVNKVDRIGYFALKDIEKGTEITTDYDFDRGDVHKCFCGEAKCKGIIGRGILKK